MCDEDECLVFGAMSFEKVANNLLCVDINAGVKFVKESDVWRKHSPNQCFEFFLLTAGEAIVETAMEKC